MSHIQPDMQNNMNNEHSLYYNIRSCMSSKMYYHYKFNNWHHMACIYLALGNTDSSKNYKLHYLKCSDNHQLLCIGHLAWKRNLKLDIMNRQRLFHWSENSIRGNRHLQHRRPMGIVDSSKIEHQMHTQINKYHKCSPKNTYNLFYMVRIFVH